MPRTPTTRRMASRSHYHPTEVKPDTNHLHDHHDHHDPKHEHEQEHIHIHINTTQALDADEARKLTSKRDKAKVERLKGYATTPTLVEVVDSQRCDRCKSGGWRCYIDADPTSDRFVCYSCGKNRCSFSTGPRRPTKTPTTSPTTTASPMTPATTLSLQLASQTIQEAPAPAHGPLPSVNELLSGWPLRRTPAPSRSPSLVPISRSVTPAIRAYCTPESSPARTLPYYDDADYFPAREEMGGAGADFFKPRIYAAPRHPRHQLYQLNTGQLMGQGFMAEENEEDKDKAEYLGKVWERARSWSATQRHDHLCQLDFYNLMAAPQSR